jgi:hypothetical protein
VVIITVRIVWKDCPRNLQRKKQISTVMVGMTPLTGALINGLRVGCLKVQLLFPHNPLVGYLLTAVEVLRVPLTAV